MYATTIALCPECAADCAAEYREAPDGMRLVLNCETHREHSERVESDAVFFKKGYEVEHAQRLRQLPI